MVGLAIDGGKTMFPSTRMCMKLRREAAAALVLTVTDCRGKPRSTPISCAIADTAPSAPAAPSAARMHDGYIGSSPPKFTDKG
ncbi:hypothetical protein NBRC116588_29190 [Pyruvatibacter sp. HU-CL02332]